MNILIVSHEYPPVGGGGASACQALSEAFARKGHHVHVLTVNYGQRASSEISHNGRLKVTRVDAKRRSPDSAGAAELLDYLRKAAKAADRIVSAEHFDVCLCFFGIPGGVLARNLRRKYGLKYIVRMGGGDIPGFQERFRVLYRMTEPELRLIWRDAEALVCNSSGLKELAEEFCSRYPIQVIPNGVDAEKFHPKECVDSSAKTDRVELLTVCRLIPRKGIQDLIPALKNIEEKTGRKIRWTIAGDGPYRDHLESLAIENGTLDRIVFAGHKDREEISKLCRKADIFVFPSHKEGMPNAVLEAMAAGLPVVMRKDCQGAAELISDNGAASERSIAETLSEVIAMGPDRWKEMGQASRRIAAESYAWSHIADRYIKLMEEIISQGQTNG